MVHSVELLLDPDTESTTRRVWEALSEAGLRSPGQASRPHVTLVVAEEISTDVDELLSPVTRQLPLRCLIGAPMVFGESRFTLVRLVVPTAALLALQAEVHRICLPYLVPGPASNTLPGQWTPHLTMARRVDPPQLARAVTIRKLARDVIASVVGLRRWDGTNRIEYEIP
ncbi:2'-5' RNA ligase family protein [Mycobacterium sp.]|uniref:2'-5' RNA ligase family protein n=1 Tax=Mycobacterium sp. TaxID=1785 RepID=UPI002BD8A29F|nr:2'-5' RNA ligase family protein [Mycobacterium sp.]HME49985.1 2'-5' RNA ligase family protein [Mycobacterium sp.]